MFLYLKTDGLVINKDGGKIIVFNPIDQNTQEVNNDSIKFYILSKIGEGNLDGRIDGLGDGYEKIYFPDILII